MIDRLPQERWPVDPTCSAIQGEVPSFPSPQRFMLHQSLPTVQPTPAFPQYSGVEYIDASEAPLSAPPQILVIDDSLTVRKIMEATHRREGFSLRAFGDGVEALQWLHNHPTMVPLLVYLDICMPRMDGYAVAHYLHSQPHLSAIPIVMLTSRDGILDRVKGRLAGARGYITKPFRSEEILSATREYLYAGTPLSGASGKNQYHVEKSTPFGR